MDWFLYDIGLCQEKVKCTSLLGYFLKKRLSDFLTKLSKAVIRRVDDYLYEKYDKLPSKQ